MSFQQQKRSSSVLHARNYNTQDFSIGSDGRNSFSIPKLENYFSGVGNENLFNVSAITLPSEQTFRQNASPKRSNRHQIIYSDKKRDITNSMRQNRDKSFERTSFRTNGSHENSPLRIKPTEKSFQSQQMQTPYKPLPERLVLTKAELNEKSRQLEEAKSKNIRLASEVKSYTQKENQRSLDVESLFNKFNVNVRRLSIVETYEKYQELLVAYRQSLTQNHQVEQSLRQEVLTNEEQRAYIEALKMELKELKLSILLSPNSKNITPEEFEEMQSAKEQLGISQNECFELKQQLERFARSETTLKLMIENLRNDIQSLEEKKEEFQVSIENNQRELTKSQEQNKTLQSEVTLMKKDNATLAAKANAMQSENSRFKNDYEKLLEEIAFLKTDKIKDEEILRSQIDQLLKEMDGKDEIIHKLNSEKSHLAQENIRSNQALNNANKKLAAARNECDELAKQSMAIEDELGRERKAVVQLNSQVKELGLQAKYDAKNEKMKEKVKIQQSLKEKMKERDDLLEELERIKGDDGRKPGHVKVKKLQDLENLREEEEAAYLDEERDKIFQENKGLHRKVRILADRVNDLKEFQGKHNLLFDFVKTTAQSLNIICQSKFSLKVEQFKRRGEDLEAYFQQISDLISCLDKFNVPKTDPNQDHQQKSVNEAMKWKDEAERLKEKVKTLNKELTLSSEAQERLYKRLSKVEVELELAKKGGDSSKQSELDNNNNNKTAKLIEEISLKNLEIKKLQELVFNEEAKEMIAEIIQVNREILAQNKASRSKGKTENVESRKTVLEEEFYLLQIQEKKKYENVENLEQQNFELQNEVSRLVSELEINFSKYEHGTSAYHTYKRNEKQGQSLQNSKSSAAVSIGNQPSPKAAANLDISVSGVPESMEIIKNAKKDADTKKPVKDINLSRPKRIKKNELSGNDAQQH